MDQQLAERIATLEACVANCVRRDEFEALRGEVRLGFAKAEANFARLDAKIDAAELRMSAKIDRAVVTMLKWTFGMQISIVALAIAAFKYL